MDLAKIKKNFIKTRLFRDIIDMQNYGMGRYDSYVLGGFLSEY
jgi:hypothetical protein